MRSLQRYSNAACRRRLQCITDPRNTRSLGSQLTRTHRPKPLRVVPAQALGFARAFAAAAGKDFYDLLGVPRNAGEDEIKKSYRKLAIKHHPDRGGDEDKFKEITRAYEVLSDSEKRSRYDRFGEEGVDGDGPAQSAEDIFSQFFGGRRGRPQRQRTRDRVQPLKVTLEQMFSGEQLRVRWARQVVDTSAGSQTCQTCGGRGVVSQIVRMGPVIQQMQSTCPDCGGQGRLVQMKGQREVLEVEIHKGALNGQEIRFEGMADEHPDADTGDVVLVLQEEEHAVFKRRGADLFVERDISLVEALCGFQIELTHLDGRKILVKSAPGEVVRPLPRGFDPLAAGGGRTEWEPMEGFDCPSLPTVAQAETTDLDTLRNAIENQLRSKGIEVSAFVIDGQRAHFKQGSREQALAAKTPSGHCTLYVIGGEDGRRALKAVEGEGMPTFKDPSVRGNLFLVLNIVFPEHVTAEAQEQLREALPPPLGVDTGAGHDTVHTVSDLDPIASYNANRDRMP